MMFSPSLLFNLESNCVIGAQVLSYDTWLLSSIKGAIIMPHTFYFARSIRGSILTVHVSLEILKKTLSFGIFTIFFLYLKDGSTTGS